METKATLAAIVAAACCACGGTEQQQTEPQRVALTRPVKLSRTIEKTFSGTVREAHEISLGFKTAGRIEKFHVKEGDYVRSGQLLAQLETTDYQLGVEALQIQYDQLADEVRRTEQLYKENSVSANDYEKAVAGLKQLAVQLQVNKNKLEYTKLFAPTDGYIQSVNFSPAEMVDAGTSVFMLLDVSNMEVTVDIPSDVYQQRDQIEQFKCHSYATGEEFPLRLRSLPPKADGNQLYNLVLAFDKQQAKNVTSGMNVEVDIEIADGKSAQGHALPLCAVFHDGDTSAVWVLQPDSTVKKQPVEMAGVNNQGKAVITNGLKGDEQVVRAGVGRLIEGQKVRPVEEASKSNVGGLL